jgi:uncharacterized protein YkwD
MPSANRRRIPILALLSATLLVPTAASAAVPAKGARSPVKRQAQASVAIAPAKARTAQQECRNAELAPTGSNQPAVREAILCLHNRIRADRGLPVLREDGRLRKAAIRHSRDMVNRRYFAHTSLGGASMVDRILAARYASRNVGWSLGENLAWGTGSLATPRGVMKAWMNSPGHRANVLKRSYREIGVGVVTGTPSRGGSGATYTADFGVIRR